MLHKVEGTVGKVYSKEEVGIWGGLVQCVLLL